MFLRKHKEVKGSDMISICVLEPIKLIYLDNKLRLLEPPGRLSPFLILSCFLEKKPRRMIEENFLIIIASLLS